MLNELNYLYKNTCMEENVKASYDLLWYNIEKRLNHSKTKE